MASNPRTIDPALGLHGLAQRLDAPPGAARFSFQLRHIRERCEEVVACLPELVEQTRRQAPRRRRDYHLDRTSHPRSPRGAEARWEHAMWQKWGPNGRGTYLPTCPHLQAYQVPLKRPGEESRWGKVDLLGVSPEFLPVVNELKQPESNENVLRMLTEMAAYGIAVQEAWPTLRCEWEPAMRARFGDAVRVPEHLERVSVIGVAPTAFWARHLGWPGSDGTRRVPDEAWPCVCALVAAFREYHLDISFAVVEGTAEGQALLPTVTGARRLKLCGEGRGGAVPSP